MLAVWLVAGQFDPRFVIEKCETQSPQGNLAHLDPTGMREGGEIRG